MVKGEFMNAVVQHDPQQVGVIAAMADRYGMNPQAFEATLRATIMPKDCTKEQVAAFLIVAKQHDLNPFTKEIYAFPARGGIQAIVSVDGWMKLINSHHQFDGMEFYDHWDDDGKLVSIQCKMHRKDRSHPVEVTEYMSECYRKTDTWDRWPARMLRHKATIQAARYAFGFAGIMEPDEVERMVEVDATLEERGGSQDNQITDDRKARCDEAAAQYAPVIEYIKAQLHEAETSTSVANYTPADEVTLKQDARDSAHAALLNVRKEWDKIPAAARCDLWLAPTKGGIFTTAERSALQRLPTRNTEQALEAI
jgi:phage recombination protein Bet